MNRTHLLDANALIALVLLDHEHHPQAAAWVSGVEHMALCPVVEGALTRFLVRLGHGPTVAQSLLEGLHADPRFEFWPDDLSYREARLDAVVGHRQVTDAYLAALAAHHGGLLATFDRRLAEADPRHVVLIGA